jgi:hypothetical protein
MHLAQGREGGGFCFDGGDESSSSINGGLLG